MTVTIPRPTLGEPEVTDEHKRTVRIRLTDAEPITVSTYRYSAPTVQVKPHTLQLIWQLTRTGIPAHLSAAYLSGYELTKSGAVNARLRSNGHSYLAYDWAVDPADGRQQRTRSNYRLADDAPDWVRELVEEYAPDWPEL